MQNKRKLHRRCFPTAQHPRGSTWIPRGSHVHPMGRGGGTPPKPGKPLKTQIFKVLGASRATTAILGTIATDSLSMGPNRGTGTLFRPDFMFFGTFFSRKSGPETGLGVQECPSTPEQARSEKKSIWVAKKLMTGLSGGLRALSGGLRGLSGGVREPGAGRREVREKSQAPPAPPTHPHPHTENCYPALRED